MRRVLALALPLVAAGCLGPKTVFTDADVPKLTKFDDLMWAQAQSSDPQFKKRNRTSFTDEDYAAFSATAQRLKLTAPRLKEVAFSKGEEWNKFADDLALHAGELGDAAAAKDAGKSAAALTATRAACKGCHSKFK